MKNSTYYLVENVCRTCKFIVKKRWYHNLIGPPAFYIDVCEATTKNGARVIFKHRGFDFGLLE